MANQVNILELDINTTALVTKMTETRAEIDKLKAAQKDLIKNNDTTSDSFTRNEVEIKRLQTAYNAQKSIVTQLSTANEAFATATAAVTTAINKENKSVDDAKENNKQLLTLRNQVNTTTVEGQAAIAAINKKLDENTDFIKANVSAAEQQKMAIGDYSNQIKEAFGELNIFNGGMSGFIARSKEAGGVGPLLTSAFANITTGIGGMIKASLAFIATPLGAAIAAIAAVGAVLVGSFKFMTGAMNSTEEGSQKLARVTATISGIFKGLYNVIKPLGVFMGNAFITYFDTAAAVIDKTAKAISSALKFIGFKGAAASLDNFTGTIKKNAAAAAELSVAESKLQVAQRQSQKIQLDYQKLAEKQRQIRDDESKSIAQRQAANTQLGAILKKQSAEELAIANQSLNVANLKVKANGKSTDSLNALAEAQTNISDIQERITGQESEQLVNINSLRKEGADKAKEASDKIIAARQAATDKAIQNNNEELALYIAQNNGKKKSLEDELAFEEEAKNKRLANNDFEYKSGKISKTAYETNKLNISNEFANKQATLAVANADKELALFISNNQTKINQNQFLNDTLYQQELTRLNLISEAEATAATTRLTNGLINAEEYAAQIKAIDDKYAADKLAVDTQKIEADKAKNAIDLENQRLLDEEKFTSDFELQTAREQIRYDAELAAADKNGANKDLITAKHALAQQKIEENLQASKVAAAGATFGVVAGLLGKESAAGKAAAMAQALINTYQGITAGVKLGYPMAIPAVAAATVTGFGAVKNIISTKVSGFADGGAIPTLGNGRINNGANLAIPLSNGDDTLAYVGQGEVILNKEQQRAAGGSSFFRNLGVPGFNSGGIVGGNSNLTSQNSFKIDMDLLAAKIAQANRSLPTPVVSVTDISYQQNRVAVIENMANLG